MALEHETSLRRAIAQAFLDVANATGPESSYLELLDDTDTLIARFTLNFQAWDILGASPTATVHLGRPSPSFGTTFETIVPAGQGGIVSRFQYRNRQGLVYLKGEVELAPDVVSGEDMKIDASAAVAAGNRIQVAEPWPLWRAPL
jgi:hypothetical protein